MKLNRSGKQQIQRLLIKTRVKTQIMVITRVLMSIWATGCETLRMGVYVSTIFSTALLQDIPMTKTRAALRASVSWRLYWDLTVTKV